jgi:brefeldin A-resistance guanine nucleotide exchange factor 1
MRVPVVLHAISGYDQDVLEIVAVPTVKGLSRCIAHPGHLRNEITISPDFWSILQRLHQHEDAGPMVFDLLQSIMSSMPDIVTADNYEFTVSLANDFVSAGHVGSHDERQRDAQGRRIKGVKKPKSRYGGIFFFFSLGRKTNRQSVRTKSLPVVSRLLA